MNIQCPTCKDDDCVESERIDRCSACGWMQVVSLPSDVQKREWECMCNHNEFCNVEHKCHQPQRDEVEDKIEKIRKIYRDLIIEHRGPMVLDFDNEVRELVKLVRSNG